MMSDRSAGDGPRIRGFPNKIGVLGFSAGGYLVAEVSTDFKRRLYAPVDAADKMSARPDFAMGIYPGHLATGEDTLNPNVPVSHETSPTFLVQAEDDPVDGVRHAFGLRPTSLSITHWPKLADAWMHRMGIIGN